MDWIVICQQVVGYAPDDYFFHYGWDGERFSTRKAAIKHGFQTRGSDDFNVCSLHDNTLTGFFWMNDDTNDPEGAAAVCEQHGFTLKLTKCQPPTKSAKPARKPV